jgi:hypothetical protein
LLDEELPEAAAFVELEEELDELEAFAFDVGQPEGSRTLRISEYWPVTPPQMRNAAIAMMRSPTRSST